MPGPLFADDGGERRRKRARTDRFAHVEVHAGGARRGFVVGVRMAGQRYDRRARRDARQCTNAAHRAHTVGPRKADIHYYRIVAARHRGDGFFAGADEVGMMAELAKNCVQNDPAIRVVFRTQNGERSGGFRPFAADRERPAASTGAIGSTTEKRKVAPRPVLAGDGDFPAHEFRQALDEREPKSGAAITPGHRAFG